MDRSYFEKILALKFNNEHFHPLTCRNGCGINLVLAMDEDGYSLFCERCGYEQSTDILDEIIVLMEEIEKVEVTE